MKKDRCKIFLFWAFVFSFKILSKLTVWDPRTERPITNQLVSQGPSGKYQKIINNAKKRVMKSVNDTLTRLKEHKSSEHVPIRNLFALSKFPPRPSLRMAIAAEIFEESVRIAESQISDLSLSDTDLSLKKTADILTDSQLEELRVLAGCDAHRVNPDCDENFCFHKKFRSADG